MRASVNLPEGLMSRHRVLVAGLTFGEQFLDSARRSALEAGVRVRVRPTARDDRVDLVIEAVH